MEERKDGGGGGIKRPLCGVFFRLLFASCVLIPDSNTYIDIMNIHHHNNPFSATAFHRNVLPDLRIPGNQTIQFSLH
jgi:hypothetical protein